MRGEARQTGAARAGDNWYVEVNGTRHGPYQLAELFRLADQGRLADDTLFVHGDTRVNLETLRQRWTVVEPGDGDDPVFAAVLDEELPPMAEAAAATTAGAVARMPVERDAIVILGRRRAGKTVYLATLYAKHWKASDGLTMKALAGPTHKMLMDIVDRLKHGQWPDSTLGTRQLEFELDDHGRKQLLIAFDYAGENFSKAFVEEDQSSPDVVKLLGYLKRAAAVILLIDPLVAVKGRNDEVMDDDYGMVQAVERIRNWPGGDQVPIVLVLTKWDLTRKLIHESGSPGQFVQRHYPALLRTLGRVKVYEVSAVQQKPDADGKPAPTPDSLPLNIEKPLRFCLDQLRAQEQAREQARREQERAQAARQYEQSLVAAEHSSNRRAAFIVAAIVILGMCLCALIWILQAL